MSDKPVEPMKDSLLAQLTVIEQLLRQKKGTFALHVNLKADGTQFTIVLTPSLTRVALKLKAAELRKLMADRLGSDAFKSFYRRAMETVRDT